MVKVFVTGGSGWVGKHTVPELIKHGHEVTAIARSDASVKTLQDLGATVIRGGLEDIDILTEQATKADAVIHLAYIHDFSDYGPEGRPARVDQAAITAFGKALEGSNKPLITTSGTLGLPPNATESEKSTHGPRATAEALSFSFAPKGVRTISMRLAPSVHGNDDWGFMVMLINFAKAHGYAAYPNDGSSRWSGVHVKDAARLFRLAIEKDVPSPQALHAIDTPAVSQKQIAETIGKKLGLEVRSVSGDELQEYFSWMSWFIAGDSNPSNEITKQLTGWAPTEIGLIEDLETGTYFQ